MLFGAGFRQGSAAQTSPGELQSTGQELLRRVSRGRSTGLTLILASQPSPAPLWTGASRLARHGLLAGDQREGPWAHRTELGFPCGWGPHAPLPVLDSWGSKCRTTDFPAGTTIKPTKPPKRSRHGSGVLFFPQRRDRGSRENIHTEEAERAGS